MSSSRLSQLQNAAASYHVTRLAGADSSRAYWRLKSWSSRNCWNCAIGDFVGGDSILPRATFAGDGVHWGPSARHTLSASHTGEPIGMRPWGWMTASVWPPVLVTYHCRSPYSLSGGQGRFGRFDLAFLPQLPERPLRRAVDTGIRIITVKSTQDRLANFSRCVVSSRSAAAKFPNVNSNARRIEGSGSAL